MNSQRKTSKFKYLKFLLGGKNVPYILAGIFLLIIVLFVLPSLFSVTFDASHMKASVSGVDASSPASSNHTPLSPSENGSSTTEGNQVLSTQNTLSVMATSNIAFDPNNPIIQTQSGATHINTPSPLKAVYMSSWVAGSEDFKNRIKKMIEDTDLNAVVIDFKDSTGMLSAETGVPAIDNEGCVEHRIKDVKGLIKQFHDQGIYVIARVAIFQDSCLSKKHPEYAVKRKSDGNIWKDRKGMSWMYAGSKEVWDYNIKIARVAYSIGFDEVNMDYIRFPSDGNMKDISYPVAIVNDPIVQKPKVHKATSTASSSTVTTVAVAHAEEASSADTTSTTNTNLNTRSNILSKFFAYVDQELRKSGDNRPKISADVFGLVATNNDDLGIGQVLEKILPYVDYIAPMVYPSHFANGWNGYPNPATRPYDVVEISMSKAVARAKAIGQDPKKLRPWLQDFNMGATYTPAMVQAQMKAVNDAGLVSWMMWDPANKYSSTKVVLSK
ncbi:MAG: putative glycoside hydrolase [bacterium]